MRRAWSCGEGQVLPALASGRAPALHRWGTGVIWRGIGVRSLGRRGMASGPGQTPDLKKGLRAWTGCLSRCPRSGNEKEDPALCLRTWSEEMGWERGGEGRWAKPDSPPGGPAGAGKGPSGLRDWLQGCVASVSTQAPGSHWAAGPHAPEPPQARAACRPGASLGWRVDLRPDFSPHGTPVPGHMPGGRALLSAGPRACPGPSSRAPPAGDAGLRLEGNHQATPAGQSRTGKAGMAGREIRTRCHNVQKSPALSGWALLETHPKWECISD